MSYASNTSVSVEKSKGELERLLAKHGADQIGMMQGQGGALVMFRLNKRTYRFKLPLPLATEREFTHTPSQGYRRSEQETFRHWEQACRSKWRALCLVVKAKLEAVEAGIVTFENEFMPHVMVNPHQTLAEVVAPQLECYVETGTAPRGLPMLEGPNA